jgi:hypothetical protein
MISPPPTPARRLIGQQRLQPRPLFLSQVMMIVHRNDLPHPTQKIHRTRPSGPFRSPRMTGDKSGTNRANRRHPTFSQTTGHPDHQGPGRRSPSHAASPSSTRLNHNMPSPGGQASGIANTSAKPWLGRVAGCGIPATSPRATTRLPACKIIRSRQPAERHHDLHHTAAPTRHEITPRPRPTRGSPPSPTTRDNDDQDRHLGRYWAVTGPSDVGEY